MASKRKQQTVQFVFEASPENNITRCVISTTANTFNDQGKSDENHVLKEKEASVSDRVSIRTIHGQT